MSMLSQFTRTLSFFCILGGFLACDTNPAKNTSQENENKNLDAVNGTPVLDGSASDEAWENAAWYPMPYSWKENAPDSNDFKGRFKVLWDDNMLYVLAEITDDTLTDIHPDGLVQYDDDDCLVLYLDEDASGGDHTYNYNAFAYHIALDSKVADMAPDSANQYFDEHCISRRTTSGKISVWEVGVKVYDGKTYTDGGENIPKMLQQGKKLKFAAAYYDNDRSSEKEHVMGSFPAANEPKDKAWQNADNFGLMELK